MIRVDVSSLAMSQVSVLLWSAPCSLALSQSARGPVRGTDGKAFPELTHFGHVAEYFRVKRQRYMLTLTIGLCTMCVSCASFRFHDVTTLIEWRFSLDTSFAYLIGISRIV